MSEPFEFDRCESIDDYVFQALGAASVCWDDVSGAGVFDSERAVAIGQALLIKIKEYRDV